MKTQGVTVVDGVLCIHTFGRGVPEAFWGRLKHEATKARLMDEFRADYAAERDRIPARAESGEATSAWTTLCADREQALFRRWVLRVLGEPPLWPWEMGWTPELVDSYLVGAEPKREAA